MLKIKLATQVLSKSVAIELEESRMMRFLVLLNSAR
jgi:uncharacterized protein (DUF1778 family)